MIELTTWFRRAIWFLAFTSATTLSPGLFAVAAVMTLIFELVYNITNARMYWESVIGYNNVDQHDKGNINYVDDYDKADYEYDQADYDYPDYSLSRNIQNIVNPRLTNIHQALVPAVRNFRVYPARRFIGAQTLMNVPPYRYHNMYRNTLVQNRLWPMRRSGVEPDEDEDSFKSTSNSSVMNWRYLLGLPPWFLKE